MAVAPLEAGSVVGRRYRLERELTQQGGMGVVWTAVHLVTKRRVAIKLLRAGGQDDPASRARLLREARASCAVDHPNVLPVLDVIDADGAPALVMELLEGESLRERLERTGPIGAAETCALLAPVAEALAAAHAASIVHRDIKPENIFLVGAPGGPSARPTVKVLDFGIAKIVTETAATNLTESGAMLGTPYYMSPEQAFGERDVGAAADAWALGIVLYECLSGTRPTQADNLGQVIKRITRDPIAPVEENVAGVPAALAEIIGRLLQRDVAAREVDMTRVARTLATCAEAPSDTSDAHEAAPPPKRRSRSTTAIALALALAAAGSLAFALVPRTPPAARAEPPAAPSATTALVLAPEPAPTVAATIAVATASASAIPSARTAARTPAPLPLTPTAPATVLPTATPPPIPTEDAGSTGPGHVIIKPPF